MIRFFLLSIKYFDYLFYEDDFFFLKIKNQQSKIKNQNQKPRNQTVHGRTYRLHTLFDSTAIKKSRS